MTISTVRVGPFTANNVDCVVLPPDKRGVPLLLGQSFINQFTHKVDNGRLLLSKVETNEPQGKAAAAKKNSQGQTLEQGCRARMRRPRPPASDRPF